MPEASAGGGTKKAAAARREAKPKPIKAQVIGVDVELPPTLPGTFALDLGAIESAWRDDDQGPPFADMFDLLRSVLDEDAVRKVRKAMGEKGDDSAGVKLWFQAVSEISGAYGSTEGE